jgi:hypothetical protein
MMADKLPDTIKSPKQLSEVLQKLDKDLNDPTAYAPPHVRKSVEPEPGLLGATDATAEVIMGAIAEAEKKMAALKTNAEHGIGHIKAWMNEFATQHAELLATINELEGRVNQAVERIVEIGKKPLGGNGGKQS